MNAQIFEYKGFIGATTDLENGEFINDPTEDGQLGCVVASENVDISPTAKKVIKESYQREGGSFAEFMLTSYSDDSGSSVGFLGFHRHHLGRSVCIGRDCDLDVLDNLNEVEIEVPDDYKEFIDMRAEK